VLGTGAAAIGALAVLVPATPAAAHSPHDQIPSVAVSADFGPGRGTGFAISRERLLRSTDGGETWGQVNRGITTRAQVSAVALTPADPDRAMVSSRGGGAFRSDDGGDTWREASDGLARELAWIAMSPNDPDLAFAGGTFGTGLFRTVDGGASWSETTISGATTIAFAPDDASIVAVGDLTGGLYRSDDGGATWSSPTQVTSGEKAVRTVVIGPGTTDRTLLVGTDGDGLRRSTDGGTTFTDGPDLGDPRVRSIVAPSSSREGFGPLWASTWAGGVCRSDDGGRSWACRSEGLTTDRQADELPTDLPQFGQLAANGDGRSMLLAGYDGLFRSTDGGETWREVETQPSDAVASIALVAVPDGPPAIALTHYLNGLLVSTDGGETWEPRSEGLANPNGWTRREDYVNRLIAVTPSPDFANHQTLFTSLRGYLARSTDAGRTWRAMVPEGIANELEQPPDYFLVAVSPAFADDGVVVLGSSRGKVLRSDDRGDTFSQVDGPGVEITAMAMSPDFAEDEEIVAATRDGVIRSTDGGRTWVDAEAPPTEVTSLSLSPTYGDDGRIWAGTLDGLFTTTDLDDGWTEVVGDGLPRGGGVESVVPAPTPDEPFLLVSLRGRGLHLSTDDGASFTELAPELLADHHQFSNWYQGATEPIAFSPDFATDRTIYGYSAEVLFRSTDAGRTWAPVERPVPTHDTDLDAASAPMLTTPLPGAVGVIGETGSIARRGGGGLPLALLVAGAVAASAVGAGVVLVRRRATN
jgi:photosystem II stability/assembly factor-like uncharacterized protein